MKTHAREVAMSRPMRTVTHVTGALAALFFGAAALVGCAASTASHESTTVPVADVSAEEEEATAGLVDHHRHHHHGGVTLLVAMSLDTLGISPDQQAAVEKIRRDLHARMDPARAAEQNLLNTLADGLAGGAIDLAKVDAAIGQLSNAAAGIYEASADALNQLHAVLTPPQRIALVDKLEAHWSVWQKANGEEGDQLAELASELDLAPGQVDRIRASLPMGMKVVPRFDAAEVSAYIQAFGDAFKAPTFDARTLASGGAAAAHMVGWGGAHMAHLVESVSPVLTPDQRAKFAQRLREHASHNPSANRG
jgi:Spy/CpxP family protein refolding chaperone